MKKSAIADNAVLFFATGFGSGYSPVAPGTAGSMVGVAVYCLIYKLHPASYLAITVAITLVGIPLSTRAEQLFGGKDSKQIVIDEVAGQLIALFMVPFSVPAVAGGFLLFRFFDIWKFGPVAMMEKLDGGAGVMLDDVAAGLLALAVLQMAIRVF